MMKIFAIILGFFIIFGVFNMENLSKAPLYGDHMILVGIMLILIFLNTDEIQKLQDKLK